MLSDFFSFSAINFQQDLIGQISLFVAWSDAAARNTPWLVITVYESLALDDRRMMMAT